MVGDGRNNAADLLVMFGITVDLARKMTFRSLYRLERRAEPMFASVAPGVDTALREFAGRVSDSGEGRWTCLAAIEEGVPAPVLTTALYSRFASRHLDEFAGKALSAMRQQFGGHREKFANKAAED